MLKTNSKKATYNIWKYLESFIDCINDEIIKYDPDLTELKPGNEKALAAVIYHTYTIEKKNNDCYYNAGRISDENLFADWAQGLPMCGIFDYWYYTTAVRILGDILEEDENERAKYTEDDAAKMLTHLIYREVIKNK